ncbi:MAG: hypothetical protein AB9897_03995 [Anaerolineaceae bacterium]
MASKSNSANNNRAEKPKPYVSAQQRKMRGQQIGMAIFAIILIMAMILSLVIR